MPAISRAPKGASLVRRCAAGGALAVLLLGVPSAHAAGVKPAAKTKPAVVLQSGVAKSVGSTVGATPGTYAGDPATLSYAWQRCADATASSCTPIAGAASSSYVLAADDDGKLVRVVETATNATGSVSQTTSTYGAVAALRPVARTKPLIVVRSGSAKHVGAVLGVTPGSYANPTSSGPSDVWQRCDDAAATSCAPIDGATGSSYTLAAADEGKYVRVAETVANSGGSVSQTTRVYGAIVTVAGPVAQVRPAVVLRSGVAKSIGSTVEVTPGAYDGDAANLTYAWQRCDDAAGAGCAAIGGATSSTYKLAAADDGKFVQVVETATNRAGTATQTSGAYGAVVMLKPVARTRPVVIGSAKTVGSRLSVSPGTYANPIASGPSYVWQRCADAAGSACTAIDGATSSTYTLDSADADKYVRVVERVENSGGAAAQTTSTFGPAVETKPVAVSAPSINGDDPAITGTRLSVSAGSYRNASAPFAYVWQRCDDAAGSGCAAIDDATEDVYVVTGDDADKFVRVVETARNVNGTTSQPSAARQIAPPTPTNTTLPSIESSDYCGSDCDDSVPYGANDQLTLHAGSWTGSPQHYHYRVQVCDQSYTSCSDPNRDPQEQQDSDETSVTFNSGSLYAGSYLRLIVTATNANGTSDEAIFDAHRHVAVPGCGWYCGPDPGGSGDYGDG